MLITDREFAPTMREALRLLQSEHGREPVVIDVCDSEYTGAGETARHATNTKRCWPRTSRCRVLAGPAATSGTPSR